MRACICTFALWHTFSAYFARTRTRRMQNLLRRSLKQRTKHQRRRSHPLLRKKVSTGWWFSIFYSRILTEWNCWGRYTIMSKFELTARSALLTSVCATLPKWQSSDSSCFLLGVLAFLALLTLKLCYLGWPPNAVACTPHIVHVCTTAEKRSIPQNQEGQKGMWNICLPYTKHTKIWINLRSINHAFCEGTGLCIYCTYVLHIRTTQYKHTMYISALIRNCCYRLPHPCTNVFLKRLAPNYHCSGC